MKVVIVERGWPAHFICGERCHFRRNTLVECGRRRFVVSTVGAMKTPPCEDFEEIGADRYFETMIFRAKKNKPYWDADVRYPIYGVVDKWCIIEPPKFSSDAEADAMHDAAVAAVVRKLKQGEVLK